MTLPLRIFEPRYLQMVDDCIQGEPLFGVVCIKEGAEVGGPAEPYEIGTVARIIGVEKKRPGLLHITTVGQERFRTRQLRHDKPYLVGEVEPYPLAHLEAPEVGVLIDAQVTLLSVYLELLSQVNDVEIRLQRSPDTPEAMAFFIAMLLQLPLTLKQRLLAATDLPGLLHEEATFLRSDIGALTLLLQGQEVVGGSHAPALFSGN